MVRLLFLIFAIFFANALWAQDNTSNANVVFAKAMQIYTESQKQGEAAKKAAAIEVLRLFDLIVTAYPDSIPGKRIKSDGGERVGPIDLVALRALAGETAKTDNPSPAQVTVAEPKSPPPEQAEPKEWYQRVLPSGVPYGGFGHGDYPSVGQRTHPGIDLVSACGLDVTAPWNATVERVIKAGDADFPRTGNAVILRHSGRWDPAVFSAYFFLGATPAVREGDVTKGQTIGQTGPLHDPAICGVHFEVRNFGTEKGPIQSLWHNVLGVGDWGEDAEFKESWREPVAWLKLLAAISRNKGLMPELLVQKDWVSVYRPGMLGLFNKPLRIVLSGHHATQGLQFSGYLRAERVLGGIAISTNYVGVKLNKAATISQVKTGESLSSSLRASIYSFDKPDEPLFQVSAPSGIRFENGLLKVPKNSTLVVVPQDELIQGDFIRVDYITEDGRSFLLGQDISLNVALDEDDTEQVLALAEHLADTVRSCVKWDQDESASITFALFAASDNRLKISRRGWVDYNGLSRFRVSAVSKDVIKQIDKCKDLRLLGMSTQQIDWFPLEMVLGGAKQ